MRPDRERRQLPGKNGPPGIQVTPEIPVISTERLVRNPLGMKEEWDALLSAKTEGERKRRRDFFVQLATTLTYDWLSTLEVIAFILEQTPKQPKGKNDSFLSRQELQRLSSSPAVREAIIILREIDTFYTKRYPKIVKWTARPDSLTTFGLQDQAMALGRIATLGDMIGSPLIISQEMRKNFGATDATPPQFYPMVLRTAEFMQLMTRLQIVSMQMLSEAQEEIQPTLLYQEENPVFSRIGDLVRGMKTAELPEDHYNIRIDILSDLMNSPLYKEKFGKHSLESVLAQEDDLERAYQLLELIVAFPKGDAIIQELIALLFVPMTGNAPVESIHHPELLRKLVATMGCIVNKLFFPALAGQLEKLSDKYGVKEQLNQLTLPDKKFDRLFSFALGVMDHTIIADVARALHSTALLGEPFLRLLEQDLGADQKFQLLTSDLESRSRQPFTSLAWLEQIRTDPLRTIHQSDYRLAEVMKRATGDFAKNLHARFGEYNQRKVELLLINFEQFVESSPEEINGNTLAFLVFKNLGESFVQELSSRVQELANISQDVLRELFSLQEESGREFAYFGAPGLTRIVEFDEETLPRKLGLEGVHFVTREDGAVEFLLFPSQFLDNTIFGVLSGSNIDIESGSDSKVASNQPPNIKLELELPEKLSGLKLLLEHLVIATFYDLCVRQRKRKQIIEASAKDILRGKPKVGRTVEPAITGDTAASHNLGRERKPLSLPRVTAQIETVTFTQLQEDIEAAEAGTRVFTPREVPAHSRYLQGGERYHQARVAYERGFATASEEEKHNFLLSSHWLVRVLDNHLARSRQR